MNNPFHVTESHLKRIKVNARSKYMEEIEVSDGYHIHWFFWTNGDIEFSIINQNGLEVN